MTLRQKNLDQIKTFQDKSLIKVAATHLKERTYIQVTEDMTAPETMERELAPLRAIRDAYPKMVVAMRGSYPAEVDGIQIVNGVDFLLHR